MSSPFNHLPFSVLFSLSVILSPPSLSLSFLQTSASLQQLAHTTWTQLPLSRSPSERLHCLSFFFTSHYPPLRPHQHDLSNQYSPLDVFLLCLSYQLCRQRKMLEVVEMAGIYKTCLFMFSLRDCGVTFVSGGGGDGGGVTSEKTVKAVDGISTSVSVKSLDVFVTSEGCHHRIHLGRPWEDVQQRL